MKILKSYLNEVSVQYTRKEMNNAKITSSNDAQSLLRNLNPVPLDHRED